jgi:hypothetical protein
LARSRSMCCVVLLALFCGTALGSRATMAQEASDSQGSVADGSGDDAALPPPPPPIFRAIPDEQPKLKAKPKILNPYDPIGIRAGAFILRPTLEIGVESRSNVRQVATNPQGDVAVLLKPSLSFASDWSRHSLSGNVTGQWLRYGTVDDLSSFTGSADIDFRLDVHRDIVAEFKANTAVTQTGLGTSSIPTTAVSPRTDQTSNFSASVTKDLGGAVITSTVALARNTYGDVALSGGGVQSNSDLNYYEPSLRLRGSLGSFGARLMPFAEITYAPRTHDQALDRNGINRNSQGGSLSLGLTLDDGPIWAGEMAVTGDYRHYADASLSDSFAVGLTGKLIWSPTPLDQATLTTSVTQAETSTAGLSATKNWLAGIEASHSLADNFRLLANASLGLADNGVGYEKTATVGGGFEYSFNPDVATRLTAQQVWYVDGLGTTGYSDQSLIASLILQR